MKRAYQMRADDTGHYRTLEDARADAIELLASEHVQRLASHVMGFFVCKRKQGDFALWPRTSYSGDGSIVCVPKTYKILDEVTAPRLAV